MSIKNNKILKISTLISISSLVILVGGYFILNKHVTLVVRGEEKNISTFKGNVKELLEEKNIEFDGNDIISENLNSKIVKGQKIEIIDVKEEVIKESKEVPFEVNIIEDKNLLQGKTEVKTEGQAGKNELVYKITYHNGKEVDKKFIEEVVAIKPINKVVKKGVKTEIKVATSRGSDLGRSKYTSSNKKLNTPSNKKVTTSSNRKYMKVVATAYTGHDKTATGTTPKWGTIAVDPRVIPYGTKVYIPQFNKVFVAEDCGGSIKGNKIDIYMDSESKVYNWGRKSIDIYVIK